MALLINSTWFMSKNPGVTFLKGTVPPGVSVFQKTVVPNGFFDRSDLAEKLDVLADEVATWGLNTSVTPRRLALHELMEYRAGMPHRARIDALLEKMESQS